MEDPSNVCFPITDVSTLLNWECDGKCWIHKHSVSSLTDNTKHLTSGNLLDLRDNINIFSEYKLPSNLLPKTLFCHDFKGGYNEDRFCNGTVNTDNYRFFNWSCIDLFIYFSHKLVTIPPQGWLHAGHTHGVPVLGTLITEWNDGENIWNDILSDINKTHLFSQKLAEICSHFKFDGYLLNIENKISKELIPQLITFVKLLKSHLDLYCERKTWLLWYDSVTTEGTLAWQNKLCALNKPFFDACDGIFLNYVWTPTDLISSVNVAGNRKFDVFVGVDVWGRNCYQDGGFNVDKASSIVRSLNLSLAIFAPGWTFERRESGDKFLQRETLFWKKIQPYLYIHGPTELPFITNFCQGISFNKESGIPLFSLGTQQYQPTSQACHTSGGCVSLFMEDGLDSNGACLNIKAINNEHSKMFHRVFVCDFAANEEQFSLISVRLTLKNSSTEPASKFQIYFMVEDKQSIEGNQSMRIRTTPKGQRCSTKVEDMTVVATLMDFTVGDHTEENISSLHPTSVTLPTSNDWNHIEFHMDLRSGTSLTEVLIVPPPVGSVLWGRLHIDRSPITNICQPSQSNGNEQLN